MRRFWWTDLFISLLNVSPTQIFSVLAAAGTVMLLAWDYIGLIAIRVGPIAYVIAILISLFSGVGIVAMFLFARGDLAWRRQIIAQMKQVRTEEFEEIKNKYVRLQTEIARFNADQKQHEPHIQPPMSREEWFRVRAENANYRNEMEARFIERFSAQIIDLAIDLKRAGALDQHIQAPIWAWVQWPDTHLIAVGNEIARLEGFYNENAR